MPHNTNLRSRSQKVISPSEDSFFRTQSDHETGFATRNVMAVEGGKATLICTVRNLGENNTVSFVNLLYMSPHR